ncbi:ScbR family autoregulator-binding transcription factor [Streptomyces sp. NPDC045431]|uniref:ScbR family autoregulator-binding transcription factor n=1 Tax=Streptomyces sp. NPDC045431 TaxID=3155613 RepID=UPI0033D35A33
MTPPALKTPSDVPRGPDPRQDRSARTRELVMRAAAEVFAEHGYRESSVKDVAERTGMTKGAVYHHFPTKEVLALALVEEHYARWPHVLDEVAAMGLSPLATALEVMDRVAAAFGDDPITIAGARLQNEQASIGVELPTPYVGWIGVMTKLFQEAEAAGELREGMVPEQLARLIVASFFGTQHVSATLTGRADLAERWQELRELFLYAIRR